MRLAVQLKKGHVYRTKDFAKWTANPARLVKRLAGEGLLVRLGHGLYVHPETSKFGKVPPTDDELMRGFLEDAPFVFSGPEKWNALGLGSTAMFATPLVYNTKRSGLFELGGRSYLLSRAKFPKQPTPEWFAVDLLENHDKAGVSLETLRDGLKKALRERRLREDGLREAAAAYGTQETRSLVKAVVESRAS
ncbi:MAG: hypothetical protein WBV82_02430 [Myxococcaceae bacterium]